MLYMKKSILLTSLIAVLCLSVLFTAPADASDGGEVNVGSNSEKMVGYSIFLPLVTRGTGAPVLVSPANGSTLNTLIPTFVWEEIEIPTGMAITVEVSAYTDFSPTTTSMSLLNGNSVTAFFNLEPATQYYWRVFLYRWSDQARFPYSETWSFTTPSDGALPEAPTLKSPANGSVIESGPVVLEINEVPGATGYQFWYQEVGASNTFISISALPQFTISSYMISPGIEFEWWVRAKNEYGLGDFSLSRTFSVSNSYTADNSAKVDQNQHFVIYDEEMNTFTQR